MPRPLDKMNVFTQLASIHVLLIGIYSSDVRLPPTITKYPAEFKVFRSSDEEVVFECEASGNPEPQYDWYKNEGILSPPGRFGNLQITKEGTLIIRPPLFNDEGCYQCKAFNQYGAAMSKMSCLRRAVLEHISGSNTEVRESEVINEGEPFTLTCNPAKVFPKPTFTWALAKKEVDTGASGPQETSQGIAVAVGKRIQVDENGNLQFAYVTMADAPEDKVYKCNMYNPVLDITMGGSYSRLRVKPSPIGGIRKSKPVIQFHSGSPVIALEGQNVTIKCFYSGYPTPTVSWVRQGATSLPSGRNVIGNYNTDLTIRKVEPSDEGKYICKASNDKGSESVTIEVDVEAAPVFRSIYNQPRNRNVSEGDSVTVYCRAYAEPPASVVWYQNGRETDFEGNDKYHLSRDREELTIRDVCRDCRYPDLTVIQCKATNIHGNAYADGYINVLKKTSIVIKPEDLTLKEGSLTAQFNCAAESDDSTPVTINWYRFKSNVVDDQRITNISNRVYIGRDSTLYFHVNNYTEWVSYLGKYRCQATNGYDTAVADVTLTAENLKMPFASEMAGIGDLWWIFVIVAAIFMLFIFLICCCICLQRNKGDTYPVDKKERNDGNNPEKELADGAFHDYQRPEGEPLKGSRASLSSSIKIDSDEEGSLNEYGDIDTGKFTEDGSFIGNYGVERKRANPNGNAGERRV